MAKLNWLQRLATLVTGTVPAPATADRPLREAAGKTVDEDEGWRRLTGQSKRDLSPMSQTRMQELALYLWEANPLANWLIEIAVAYLLAEGVRPAVDDEQAQGWLDGFWDDPINDMDLKLTKKVRELSLYGEQCWPVFANKINGHVRLGYLDPGLIETVVMDPDSSEQPIGVVTVKNAKGEARRYRVIVNGPESVFSERTQEIRQTFTDGDAFYFKVNDLSNSSRGRSDLLAGADWLDGYDQFLFGELERASMMRAFIWDVTLQGATQDEVDDYARKVHPPKSGGMRVHNETETWTAESPDLKAGEATETARLMRNQVLGGRGMPEHWFGGGGDVNRATAGEMGEPTMKVLTMRQRIIKHVLESLLIYVVRQRYRAVMGSEELDFAVFPDFRPRVDFPEITARDTTKYAAAMAQVVSAVSVVMSEGLLSEETAMALIAAVAERLGVEIDPVTELERAREQADKRREADTFTEPPDDSDDAEIEPMDEKEAEAA